jgi:hypothetical protein
MNLASLPVTPAALVLLVFGVVNCFWGYRIFRVVLALWGFVLGAAIGVALAGDSGTLMVVFVALVGGLIGAGVFVLLYFVGVFAAGAILGFLLTASLMNVVMPEPNAFVAVIGALVVGLLALAVNKLIIILSTSFAGAWSLVQAAALMFSTAQADRVLAARGPFDLVSAMGMGAVIGWLVLGVLGVIVQYRVTAEDDE